MRCPLRKSLFTSSWQRPHFQWSATKHSKDSDGIYHGIESLVKVNTWLLVKAFSNMLSFIPCNRAIEIFLMRNTHFLSTIFCPSSGEQETRYHLLDESIIFFMHSLNPLRILESSSDNVGFRGRGKYGGEAISQVGFRDGIFRAGLQGMKV